MSSSWFGTKGSVDKKDPNVLLDLMEEAVKLRVALASRWINNAQLVQFLDKDRNGSIDYEEFYDGLSQFGLTDDIDVDKVFALIDKDDSGEILMSDMIEALRLTRADADDHTSSVKVDADLTPFPETLLVGLVAHNDLKPSMMLFVKENLNFFKRVRLVTTGSTGRSLTALGLHVDTLVSSGPLGGDQEIGGMISQGKVAAVFFFTDPLSSHPHEADIQALNRICCVHDTMFANNPSTASSLIFALEYSAFGFSRLIGKNPDYQKKDSKIVENYKTNQQAVIKAVQGRKSTTKRAPVLNIPNPRMSVMLKPEAFKFQV